MSKPFTPAEVSPVFREFTRRYTSATPVSTGHNHCLRGPRGRLHGRVFYPVSVGGTFPFSFLVQNRVDSTFDNGRESHADLCGGEWRILSAKAGDGGPLAAPAAGTLHPVTFGGREGRAVAPGEVFYTDECTLTVPQGHYLCFEWEVEGDEMPYTPDKFLMPCFLEQEGQWVPSCAFPQPVSVGCVRPVAHELTFLGDSITQGLGTTPCQYAFWVAEIARRMAPRCSVRNIGLGFARAADAAQNGVWLEKAKAGEVVFVCLGVNDLLQDVASANGSTPDLLIANLRHIVQALRSAGCRVGVLAVPPFNFLEDREKLWRNANKALQEFAQDPQNGVEWFLPTPVIWGEEAPRDNLAKYGASLEDGHPRDNGGLAMGEYFCEHIRI